MIRMEHKTQLQILVRLNTVSLTEKYNKQAAIIKLYTLYVNSLKIKSATQLLKQWEIYKMQI